MMSKAWCEKNGVEKAQDFNAKQETYAVRNANGTGPFRLERYEPDVRTRAASRHPGWWGWADKRNGNLDEVSFVTDPVRRHAAGGAGLGRGRPGARPAVPGHRAAEGRHAASRCCRSPTSASSTSPSTSRATSCEGSDVKGRNPFKDLRVRQAVYHAINVDLIVRQGAARPGRADRRLPVAAGRRLAAPNSTSACPTTRRKAQALLAEAGYPNGFAVTLDCVNVAWRENVCQAAAAMLTQVGIRTTLRSVADEPVLPQAQPGHGQLHRVRLDADARRLGDR